MRARPVPILMVLALLLAALGVTGAAAETGSRLLVSTSSNRASPVPLEGGVVRGAVAVFLEPSSAVTVSTVQFWIDDPGMAGLPIRTERTRPYDLVGGDAVTARLWDSRTVADGVHTLTAVVASTTGSREVVRSTFTVQNSEPSPAPTVTTAPPATTGGELLVSSSSSRSTPVPLDARTLTGLAYVFVAAAPGLDDVVFFLDDPTMAATPYRVEANPPFDLMGGTTVAANALDTTRLAVGSHTLTARLVETGGTRVVRAGFTVGGTSPTPVPTVPVDPAAPSQVHLSWTADASTTFTVTWRTRSAATPPELRYRPAGLQTWTTTTGRTTTGPASSRLATAMGLVPGTTYEYSVRGDGDVWAPVRSTRTVDRDGPVTAAFIADTGLEGRLDGLTTGTRAVVDSVRTRDPHLVLGGGDYAYYNTDTRYGTLGASIDAWFDQMSTLTTRSPLMPTYGNHEVLLGEGFVPWADRFSTPTGVRSSAAGDTRSTYAFDVGPVRFLSVLAVAETTSISDVQKQWISDQVTSARASGIRWVVPYMHGVPLGEGRNHPVNQALQADLGPLFERLDIPVVLYAHDQSFERSYPLTGLTDTRVTAPVLTSTNRACYQDGDGVVWLKSGPGGKLSNKNGSWSQFRSPVPPVWTARRANDAHHWTMLTADRAMLQVTTYGVDADGTERVQDQFRIQSEACP